MWAALVPCALVVAAFVLVSTVVIGKQQQRRVGSSSIPARRTALYIGDSLSVGKFGELLHDYLVATFGPGNVGLYASCGSSPENWLRAEPTFFTKCGYREQTPNRNMAIDSRTHHGTPKLDDLVSRYRPTTAIVQLGTNWMDRPLPDAKIRSILESFMDTLHATANCKVVWIGPPDSSKFSGAQGRIYKLIQQNRRSGDIVIDSRRLTHYVPGKTGGDGIHYNSQSSAAWAARVIDLLEQVIPKPRTAQVPAGNDASALSMD